MKPIGRVLAAALMLVGRSACSAEDTPAALVSRGASAEAMAINAQGAPFLALGGDAGAISRVIARNTLWRRSALRPD